MSALPAGKDLSDTAAVLAAWESRNGLWGAKLVRNYAGAHVLLETKRGKSCGCISTGTRYDDSGALGYFRGIMPQLFDVTMYERSGD